MNYQKNLRKIAEHFGLEYKGNFQFLKCSNREVSIRNFLGGCPMKPYIGYGSTKRNSEDFLEKFICFLDFSGRQTSRGCIVTQQQISREVGKVNNLKNKNLKNELLQFYKKVQDKIGTESHLTLICDEKDFDNTLLHEFVHEIMDINNIKIKDIPVNEGLVTYMTHYGLGNADAFYEKSPKVKESSLYIRYAKKIAKLFKNTKTSAERKKLILGLSTFN